ncbi:DegT/DnrJ/EryC1/StrS family aminotransferase [Infirmifilum sp.]|jgi:dTDP-4-amino-4,6-dideoxygalactose transaminase|uniref:DegT/DnrJ/EryC1/StrS family aminotransferase n=1 Tax=Infirmifilum sp. TaxID=2856575 RepID=UPI003D0C3FC0
MRYRYPLIKPSLGREELEELKKVFLSGWLTQGPYVKEFERRVAEYVGAKHALAVTSCTTALYLTLKALGVKSGGKVVVPDFTFPATANAAVELGARPILVDVNEEGALDPQELRRILSENKDVKAVIVVHPFGHALNIEVYKEVIEEAGLNIPVIEDAATALGSTCNGRFAGNMGDFGCYSFHPRKLVTTGEGGMIVLNDDVYAEKLRILRDHGRNMQGVFVENSLNFRMSDIQAAIGIVQLRRLESTIEQRRRLAELYHRMLNDLLPQVRPFKEKKGCRSTYQSYVIRLPDKLAKYQRRIINQVKEKFRVEVQIGTYALHMEPAFRKFVADDSRLRTSETLRRTTLTLPLYEGLKEEDIEYIVNALATIYKSLE